MHAGRPRQQFRRRPLDEDAGPDDTAPGEAAAAPPAASLPAGVRKAAPQRATLLSFADDGGDGNDALAAPPPQLAGKKRVVAAAVRASNAEPVTGAGALRPPSGEYSAARLKELAAAQRTLPGSLRPAVASAADVRPIQPRVIASSAELGAQDSSFERPSLRGGVPDAVIRGLEALDADEHDEEGGAGGHVPDREAIRRAKKARERARGVAQRAADFVPLAGAVPSRAPVQRGAGGDAEAEGASDQSGDEEDVRVAFVGSMHPPDAGQRPEVTADAGMSVDARDDEERFVEEQLLRAGLSRAAAAQPRKPRATPGAGGAVRSAAAASAAALASVREGLSHAQTSLNATNAELSRTRESLVHCEAQIQELEVSGVTAGERYRLVQEFRDYVRDLCECLKDKAPLVEELEDQVAQLEEAAASAYAERADADAEDEALPASAAVSAAQGALARGAGESVAADAAAAAAAMASAAGGASLPPLLDELGRDQNAARRVNATRRAINRAARRRTHPPAAGTWTPPQSSDSSDGERVSLASRLEEVSTEATAVFADAADEYGSLVRVKTRLEAFKRACGRAYRDAYVAESAPALCAPYVRLQLLTWSPVRPPPSQSSTGGVTSGVALDEQPWFQDLFDFVAVDDTGATNGGGSNHAPDADVLLIPRLVAKVIIPRVKQAVEHAWRPDRRRQSLRLAAVLSELAPFAQGDPEFAADLTILHGAVAAQLAKAAGSVRVPAWSPTAVAIVGESAHSVAASCAARAIRLLTAISAFNDVLPLPALVAPAMETLLLRQLVPHLQALAQHPSGWPAAARRLRRAAGALPAAWISSPSHADVRRGVDALALVASSLARALLTSSGEHDEAALGVRETLMMLGRAEELRAIPAVHAR